MNHLNAFDYFMATVAVLGCIACAFHHMFIKRR